MCCVRKTVKGGTHSRIASKRTCGRVVRSGRRRKAAEETPRRRATPLPVLKGTATAFFFCVGRGIIRRGGGHAAGGVHGGGGAAHRRPARPSASRRGCPPGCASGGLSRPAGNCEKRGACHSNSNRTSKISSPRGGDAAVRAVTVTGL